MSSKKLLVNNIVQEALKQVTDDLITESVKRSWSESDVVLRSGRAVKFGCKAHINELDKLIDDLCRVRSRQSFGSATRARLGDAISALRKEMRAARKKYALQHPETIQ